MYRIFPIILGTAIGVLAWVVLTDSISGRTATASTQLLNSFLFGSPIGAGIGFLVGDKLRVIIKKKNGLVFKIKRSDEDEEQDESATSRPIGTSGTSTVPPRPAGTGGTSPPPPPRPLGGTAATSGSETLD